MIQKVKLVDPFVFISGGLIARGEYDAATDYGVGDCVSYLGSSYVMYSDATAGTVPTNTTYWQVISQGLNVASIPILATGTGKTVDDVITTLQTLGLVRQS